MKRAIIFIFFVVYPNSVLGFDSNSFDIMGIKLGMGYNEVKKNLPESTFEPLGVYGGGVVSSYELYDYFIDGGKISIALTTDKLGKKVWYISRHFEFSGFQDLGSIIKKLVNKYGQYDDKKEANYPIGKAVALIWDGRIIRETSGTLSVAARYIVAAICVINGL